MAFNGVCLVWFLVQKPHLIAHLTAKHQLINSSALINRFTPEIRIFYLSNITIESLSNYCR